MPRAFAMTNGEREIFARREILPPSVWAQRNIIVQDGLYAGSPVRMDVSPYMAGMLDIYARRNVEEVIVCGSPQIGKTLILYICLGWCMDYRPGTKMLAMPTKETRDRVKKDKLLPLIKGSPVLRRQLLKARLDNIALRNGTNIWLSTAESPSQRASITVQDLFLDEEDLYGTAGSSNAVEDFRGRTRSLGGRAKILRVSQPKGDVDASGIFRSVSSGVDQLYCYEVRCPACREYHLPDVDNLKIEHGEKDVLTIRRQKLARYVCPACKWAWSDHIRDLAVANGRWAPYVYFEGRGFQRSEAPVSKPRIVGFHVPAILARSVSLSHLAARKLAADASEDPRVRMQFANDELSLPYQPVELQTDEEKIFSLREMSLPPLTVPHGAVAITCGIDVQKRGFWYLCRAWMPTLASYVIDYGYLDTWDDVSRLLFETYYAVLDANGGDGGERMPVWRAAVDSGGTETEGVYTRTEEVYMWVRAYGSGVAFACKGASREQTAPVRWVMRERMPHNGRPIPGGLRLHLLDTNVFKTLDFSRMLNPESRQPLRLHSGCEMDLAAHLSSERLVRRGQRLVWEHRKGPNHLLDCLMLSAACADASWTPSLPLYVLQLRRQAQAANEPRPAPKKKERPQRERRWG
jgi:phage terminase large subunit GpA-like protein